MRDTEPGADPLSKLTTQIDPIPAAIFHGMKPTGMLRRTAGDPRRRLRSGRRGYSPQAVAAQWPDVDRLVQAVDRHGVAGLQATQQIWSTWSSVTHSA